MLGACEGEANGLFDEIFEFESVAVEVFEATSQRLIADPVISDLNTQWLACLQDEAVFDLVSGSPETPIDLLFAVEEGLFEVLESGANPEDFLSTEIVVASAAASCAGSLGYAETVIETTESIHAEELASRGFG